MTVAYDRKMEIKSKQTKILLICIFMSLVALSTVSLTTNYVVEKDKKQLIIERDNLARQVMMLKERNLTPEKLPKRDSITIHILEYEELRKYTFVTKRFPNRRCADVIDSLVTEVGNLKFKLASIGELK